MTASPASRFNSAPGPPPRGPPLPKRLMSLIEPPLLAFESPAPPAPALKSVMKPAAITPLTFEMLPPLPAFFRSPEPAPEVIVIDPTGAGIELGGTPGGGVN